MIFALAVLSFHDARPRGTSHIDYIEADEWALDDFVCRLRFWQGALWLDTDYVQTIRTELATWASSWQEQIATPMI